VPNSNPNSHSNSFSNPNTNPISNPNSTRTVKPKQIEGSNRRSVIIFSVIFSLNIAIGNTSLRYVSVNFNQVCRALVPVIVMGISMFYYGKSFSMQRKLSVLPIVFGVALAFYGDMSFSAVGAFYTLFCVVLAALKAVVGGELLTGDLKLHEIDLLSKMCPLALLQIGLVSVLTGRPFYLYLSSQFGCKDSQPHSLPLIHPLTQAFAHSLPIHSLYRRSWRDYGEMERTGCRPRPPSGSSIGLVLGLEITFLCKHIKL
jgi:hypothetical protein